MSENTETRLTRAELQIRQHEKMHEATQEALRQMAEGINQLSQIEARREEDQKTFGRIFTELKEMRENDIKPLRADFEAYKGAQTDKELEAAKSQLAEQNKRVWDVKSAVLSAIGMIVLWVLAEKFGIHVVG